MLDDNKSYSRAVHDNKATHSINFKRYVLNINIKRHLRNCTAGIAASTATKTAIIYFLILLTFECKLQGRVAIYGLIFPLSLFC